ncbi:MAG: DUF2946 domain-containing protein [Burkholderiaceae bacterium]
MVRQTFLRSTSFLALITILVLAFAPPVSRFVAAERADASLAEVCTAEGMKWVAVSGVSQFDSGSQDKTPISAHDHSGDCPYCSLQTAKFLHPHRILLQPRRWKAPFPLFSIRLLSRFLPGRRRALEHHHSPHSQTL